MPSPPHLVDLHTHSRFSDGADSPDELARAARQAGLVALGLADHDTLDGVAETAAAAARRGLLFVPGIEISTSIDLGRPQRTAVHLLAYLADLTTPELAAALQTHARDRVRRVEAMVGRLRALGVPVDLGHVLAAGEEGSVGRPHIAKELVRLGYAEDTGDAFRRWLGRGCPAYVPRPPVETVETVGLVRRAGGVPVLAHPDEVGEALADLLAVLVPAGLVGMEAAYGPDAPETRERLRRLAERHGLIVTGGSDYHGLTVKAANPIGMGPVSPQALADLVAAAAAVRAAG